MEQVYAASEAAKADAYGFTALETAEIKLGVMSTIGPTQIVGFLTRLNQDIPAIELSVCLAPDPKITKAMSNLAASASGSLPSSDVSNKSTGWPLVIPSGSRGAFVFSKRLECGLFVWRSHQISGPVIFHGA